MENEIQELQTKIPVFELACRAATGGGDSHFFGPKFLLVFSFEIEREEKRIHAMHACMHACMQTRRPIE